MLITVGTSGAVVAPTTLATVDPEMRIHSMAHAERDTWYLMGVVLSAGAALAWWRGTADRPRAPNLKAPLVMNVAPYDQGNPAGTVAGWMRFPADVPRSVVLAGFRTPVGTGQMGTGDEVFMTLCGLHGAGVRSVLLSRWAVGGESASIALRELVQELPFTGMNASWQRARMVLRRSELDPAAEPLLTQADHEFEGLTGDQPLFWAGYLISAPAEPAKP